jgi:hypothetical protein
LGGGDPLRGIGGSSLGGGGRCTAARWFLGVEAAELGGAVFFLAGDSSDDVTSTGWFSRVEGMDDEAMASV